MAGLSTIGDISLDFAFGADRKRVPSAVAGATAVRTALGGTWEKPVGTGCHRAFEGHSLTLL